MGDGIQNLLRASLHTVPSSATTAAAVPDVGYPEGGWCSGCKSALQQPRAHVNSTAKSPLSSQAGETENSQSLFLTMNSLRWVNQG